MPLEAHDAGSSGQVTASGEHADLTSAPHQAAEQVATSLVPDSQPLRLPLPPPLLLSRAADPQDLSAEMNKSGADSHALRMRSASPHTVSPIMTQAKALLSGDACGEAATAVSAAQQMADMKAGHPVQHTAEANMSVHAAMSIGTAVPTATRAATAGASASLRDATSAAVANLPASAFEPAAVDTDKACLSAKLLSEKPTSAAANTADPSQAQPWGGLPGPSAAEQPLVDNTMPSAASNAVLQDTQALEPFDETPPLQPAEQDDLPSLWSRLPASSVAVSSMPLPALTSPTRALQPPAPFTADQQPTAGEAASPAALAQTAAHLYHQDGTAALHQQYGDARDHYWREKAPAYHQHNDAPVHHRHGAGSREAGADLIYEHLAAVLATMPALRDRMLTFAPVHSQMHCLGTDKPSGEDDAGQS